MTARLAEFDAAYLLLKARHPDAQAASLCVSQPSINAPVDCDKLLSTQNSV
ncbi:hypothetical protein [Bradyrhizobium sp. USDA 4353]